MDAPKFVDDKNVDKYGIVCLLFGDSSSGKTYVSQTFPEPIYIIDTEQRAIKTKWEHFNNKEIHIVDPYEINTIPGQSNDCFDTHATIENITRTIIWYSNEVKSGRIKGGTLVIDSVSDIWKHVMEWGMIELSHYTNKDGSKKADLMLMRINNQTDWRICNKRFDEIAGSVLRRLLPYGINIVLTAREEQVPQYVVEKLGHQEITLKDKIRGHKDVPFLADVIFNLKKIENKETGMIRYAAKLEKLGAKKIQTQIITDLDYEKIKELMIKK